MAKSKSLSAETDKKIQNKEKEIQDIDARKQKLVKELRELKERQLRERNDGMGKLLKDNNIDTNQFAQKLQSNPEMLEMILMMMNEQQEQEESVQPVAEPEEQTEQVNAEDYSDSDNDYIDFNS